MNTSLLRTLAVNQIDPVGGDKDNNLSGSITTIINSIVVSLGIVAVIIIIIGGITYMTSQGDASKVKKGKDTILYGVIGLIIVVLPFAITNFVIGAINDGTK